MVPTSKGVHLVGSMPTASVEETFTLVAKHLAPYVRRVPDGEPGARQGWTQFQRAAFGADTEFLQLSWAAYGSPAPSVSPAEAAQHAESLPAATTDYDTHARASFAAFERARAAGLLAATTKFQVSLPTTTAVMLTCFKPEYHAAIEQRYTQGLQDALRKIQRAILHDALSIQFDLAVEIAVLEGVYQPWWSSDVRAGLVHRVAELAAGVDRDVELGFHLCYGDFRHQHFKEPDDARHLSTLAVELLQHIPRPINFIHLPVPIARSDTAYFAPLADLQKQRGATEVYLGLVHPDGVENTRKRMAAAAEFIRPFGVATECGMGRTPPTDIDILMSTMAAVNHADEGDEEASAQSGASIHTD